MNSEGYKDSTAEKAIHNTGHIPKHIWEPLDLVRRFLDVAGLELINIAVRDRKSKRKYSWSSWGGDTVGEGNSDGVRRYESRSQGSAKKDRKGP